MEGPGGMGCAFPAAHGPAESPHNDWGVFRSTQGTVNVYRIRAYLEMRNRFSIAKLECTLPVS